MAQAQTCGRNKSVCGTPRSSSLCTLISWFSSAIFITRNHKYIQYQRHRYKYSKVVITIWLAVTKYPYFRRQWIISALRRCYSAITEKILTELHYIHISNMTYFIKINWLALADTFAHPSPIFDGIRIAHRFSLFLTCSPKLNASLEITPGFTQWGKCCPFCAIIISLGVLSSMFEVRYDFSINKMFGSCLPTVTCMKVDVLFFRFMYVCE